MDRQFRSCLLISDFNIDNLSAYLSSDADFPHIKPTVAPFNQVFQVLRDAEAECWKNNPDSVVVWTQPENVIGSFRHVLNYKNISLEDILNEVDQYSSLLLNICQKTKAIFVPTWISPYYNKGLGMLDMKTGMGISNVLMHMNLRLSENLRETSNIFIFDAQRWANIAGVKAFNPKLWYMGKIAFGNDVFLEAVKDIKSAMRGLVGDSKKLIVLDLDNTLWGGIIGELGWEGISLGGHDHIGEAYTDFQGALRSMMNRGILLAIVSKNEETVALEAINKNPEMVLKIDDFVGWKINWLDKAKNIADLVSELNLGLQSVVFIDDNPLERARVKEALPEVYVPEWPEDPIFYKSTFLSLRCFDTPFISKEDLERMKMYSEQKKRSDLKINVTSLDEWLKGLELVVAIEDLNDANLQRTAQLLNKTNQMNLVTRRMTEAELMDWTKQKNHRLWTFSVSDKIGDSGLTGVVSVEVEGNLGKITDFILSCRVMGLKIEEAMLHTVIQYAQSLGLEKVQAVYMPTAKNKPCLSFFENSGFECEDNYKFTKKVTMGYKMPDCIKIKVK